MAEKTNRPEGENGRLAYSIELAWSDSKYAFRGLLRDRLFALSSILLLAFGIGVSCATFSAVNGVLWQALPYPDADRLVRLEQIATRSETTNILFSLPEASDYRNYVESFDEVVEFGDWTFNVLGRGAAHRATGGLVTSNYFKTLRLAPALGRVLTPDDEVAGAPPVAVLTDEYWRRAFGGDESVIGQTLDLTTAVATVVGVLGPGSHYLSKSGQDFYVNYAASDHYLSAAMQEERVHRMTQVLARLAPGVALESARSEIERVSSALRDSYPDAYPDSLGIEVSITPWIDELTGAARPALLILLAASGLLLVAAGANVSCLVLTRHFRRQRELAIRAALGSPAAGLRVAAWVENLIVGVAGASLGLVLAAVSTGWLATYIQQLTIRADGIGVRGETVVLALILALGVALVLSVAGQWTPPGGSIASIAGNTDRSGTARAAFRRTQKTLVAGQLAVSMILLTGSGLLVRTLINLNDVDLGFETENVWSLEAHDFREQGAAPRLEFARAVIERLSAHPGVESVAAASALPLTSANPVFREFRVEGGAANLSDPPLSAFRLVTPGYFDTIGASLLSGRPFEDPESIERAVIINESMARHYFDGENPVGRRITLTLSGDPTGSWLTIIGVVTDMKAEGLGGGPVHTVYLPNLGTSATTFLVKARNPFSIAGIVDEIRRLDPSRPVDRVQTLEQLRATSIAPQRLNAALLMFFSVSALAIAAVGVGGLLSFLVSQRWKELGIRSALGAGRYELIKLVLKEGILLATLGLAAGGAGSLILSRYLSSLLFEV